MRQAWRRTFEVNTWHGCPEHSGHLWNVWRVRISSLYLRTQATHLHWFLSARAQSCRLDILVLKWWWALSSLNPLSKVGSLQKQIEGRADRHRRVELLVQKLPLVLRAVATSISSPTSVGQQQRQPHGLQILLSLCFLPPCQVLLCLFVVFPLYS